MINFRYHVVSLAAVLFALAGGAALGAGVLDDADDSSAVETTTSSGSDAALRQFEAGFAGRTAEGLLGGRLKGESVVVLTVPGTDAAQVKGVTSDLELAGAEVTGEIALSSKLLDSSGRQFAEGVAQQAAQDVPGVDAAGDTYGRVGAAFARAFLADRAATLDQTASTIRSAFVEGDLVTATRDPKRSATLAVLVAGPQRAGGADQSTVVAALASAIGASDAPGRGVVVAGPASSSTDGGVVKAVRDGDAASEVSTVDVTDSAAGRIVTVLAAAAQADGRPGAWGTQRSAGGAVPS